MIKVEPKYKDMHDEIRQVLRSNLLEVIDEWGISQGAAAIRLGVAREFLNKLINDGGQRASIDTLMVMLMRAGKSVSVVVNY